MPEQAAVFLRDRGAIAHHLEVFEGLESVTEDHLDRGRLDAAAAYAQIAADYAWRNHPGVFASPRLESVLGGIGRTVLRDRSGTGSARPASDPRRVLHVMTAASGIGGHTRLVWRWMNWDAERSHSLVLTGATHRLPPQLLNTVQDRGGRIETLGSTRVGLVARARRLRELAAGFDLVVLHLHPYDVLPSIALAEKTGMPPVVFVNHADHVFWIGSGAADLVAHIRDSGRVFAEQRRGIPRDRSVLLPIPLEEPSRSMSRAQAKVTLGYPADAVLLLTVAQAAKYSPVYQPHLLDVVTPVIEKNKQALLVAIGPSQTIPWKEAGERTGGRIRAIGPVGDPSTFYEAADVYLDSYPMASLTSLLEAGSLGTPLVSFCPHLRDAGILCADDPGLGDSLIRLTDPDAYQSTISSLISDENIRVRTGRETQARVIETHTGEGWKEYMEELYARASVASFSPGPAAAVPFEGSGTVDELLGRMHAASGWSVPIWELVLAHIECLPHRGRGWPRILLGRQMSRWIRQDERRRRLERRIFLPKLVRKRAARTLPSERPEVKA